MRSDIKHFNIRVYGLLINNKRQILLSDEFVMDTYMTKFPGGGLKFGEGPEDCIIRECQEEFGQEIEIIRHFYTTGFFQKALYYTDNQLISIYYLIRLKKEPAFTISEKKFDFEKAKNGAQSFRWVDLSKLAIENMTFPIDKHVAGLLLNEL